MNQCLYQGVSRQSETTRQGCSILRIESTQGLTSKQRAKSSGTEQGKNIIAFCDITVYKMLLSADVQNTDLLSKVKQ